MAKYIQVKIDNTTAEQNEILIALLSENSYDGFEEGDNSLTAFISETDFNEESLKETLQSFQLIFTKEIIAEKNWNEEWEKNFEPVLVDDFCAVRASFHQPITHVQNEILITPKMSFGTGHHATTYMMMKSMEAIVFNGKSVLDFGTGTGVLAILAEKLGATAIYAIDNDEWSINNGKENIDNNHCTNIRIEQKDNLNETGKYDIILANINRNVLLDNMQSIASSVKTNGIVLMSGFYDEDLTTLLESANKFGLRFVSKMEKNKWDCAKFTRS
ncbi:MAG: 50S ribosomal protein L11 methyltransferase [Sphingobacteriales bacterium]|nr:MAG: 50S ribosomal protein L11 methyltransferase [Sphingobacteriales bacterium]